MIAAASRSLLFFLGVLLFFTGAPVSSVAQDRQDNLLETIAEKKRQFLINRLDLTGQEQQRFFDLYDEFLLSTLRLNRERAELAESLRREYNLGNDTAKMASLATQMGLFEGRLAGMKRGFYERFKDLLGDRRFAALILAEVDFQREIDRLRAEYQTRQNVRARY